MSADADPISVEATVPAAKCQPLQATRLPLQLPRSPFHSRLRTNAFTLPNQRDGFGAFTLAELLVSMSVLVLLVFLATQLLNSAATVTTLGHKQMDADAQARQLLDRMAIDFAQMLKRSDTDYYLKSAQTGAPDCTTCGPQTGGNDQIAFFCTTSGYYPTPNYQSPISLVAYRVNSNSSGSLYNKMERMVKGFIWNGGSSSYKPILFLDGNTPPANTISSQWPAAVSSSMTDPDGNYEIVGPHVLRFEYYYQLKGQVINGTTYNSIFADTPWDTRISGHTNVSGMRDVAAIIADIAVIDSKSKVLLTDSQIASLAGQLGDYSPGMVPGQLLANWRTAIDANSIGLPQPVISGVRVYERFFYLTQ